MTTSLAIHELAPLGDGIHRADGGRIYVDRTLPGDVVEAKIQRPSGGIVRADLVRVTAPSADRVRAPCPHYDVCGGCTLQHAREDFYRAWKAETVRTALRRQGLAPRAWLEPVFLPEGKRRRVTFAAAKRNNAVVLGYHRRRSKTVAEIANCLIAEPAIMDLRRKLERSLVPILQEGKSADVFIQMVGRQMDVVLTGPVGKKGRPDLNLLEAVAQVADSLSLDRLSWRWRDHGQPEALVERQPVVAAFGALEVPLPPLAFLQPTKAGEETLVEEVMRALPEQGVFADLFAGCGTFAGAMLRRGRVDAFESAEPAVRALMKAAGPLPLRANRRDLFQTPLRPEETTAYDAIVIDPPRAGAEEQVRALAGGSTPRVIFVSCNPATFARDARILVEGGYAFETIKIIDQFTWSHHVELVATFSRE